MSTTPLSRFETALIVLGCMAAAGCSDDPTGGWRAASTVAAPVGPFTPFVCFSDDGSGRLGTDAASVKSGVAVTWTDDGELSGAGLPAGSTWKLDAECGDVPDCLVLRAPCTAANCDDASCGGTFCGTYEVDDSLACD
jgi:hypothetical protein